MLCLLLATGFMTASMFMIVIATVIFIAGLEIRTRAEDRLLSSHFGDRFEAYRGAVRAYVPFVR
jgi:protein-S-isoprenylcysteine O-methyltransferase Ste14